jgi:hypothetical protein
MTPETQRIAIAEFCGYTHVRIVKAIEGPPDIGIGHHPTEPHSIPDYINDLNAMHEAEKLLDVGLLAKYTTNILNVCGGPMSVHFATAAQRAEALLKTIAKAKGKP